MASKKQPSLLHKLWGSINQWLGGDTSDSPQATALYQLAVTAARTPYLYQTKETKGTPGTTGAGVADTIDGRFDATTLMVVLVVWRLRRINTQQARLLAQNLVDTMFADMEASLLTMGVGENTIGKRMRVLASAFGGRMQVYTAALDNKHQADLAQALTRNLYRHNPKTKPQATHLAKQILALAQAMAATPDKAWLTGKVKWSVLAKSLKIG